MVEVCVLLTEGFEEIEAVTIIDVLRRAGVSTTTLGVGGTTVRGSHGITLQADASLAERHAHPWDVVVLPGGMPGSARLRDDADVQSLLKTQSARGGRVAAICAAPIALAAAGLLEARKATCYPTFADQLAGADYQTTEVVVDGQVTTSRGVGTALPFALSLVRQLQGDAMAAELGEKMLVGA